MSFVRVSDISLYLRCPRMVYFVVNGYNLEEKKEESLKRIFWKEVFSRYSLYPNKIEISDVFKTILQTHPYLKSEDLEIFRAVKLRCSENYKEENYEIDVELFSERLRMSGILDKIVLSDEPIPVILRTSKPPSQGIYRSDRIKLTAYAMLAEERFGRVRKGYVDYAPYGIIREQKIRFSDRRNVIRIRDKIFSIYSGKLPPKKEKCPKCEFSELCDVERSLLSDLLF
jgi:CRISPR-associated exonuclease Cas4